MILIIDCGSTKTHNIHELVDEFMDCETIAIADFKSELLPNYTAVIISGAPILITEIDMTNYFDQMTWIKTFEKPLLGICFGHQIIGLINGSFASRMREDRDWQEIEILEYSELFDKLPTTFDMMQDHCETISIPQGFKLIASSDACVNEAMQHLSKPIYGVQFHPEVSGNFGRVIFQNFCAKVETKINEHVAQ